MKARVSTVSAIAAICSFGALATGCAATGKSSLPEGATAQLLRGERTVLHGTATQVKASPTCDPVGAAEAKHLVELSDDTLLTIALRPSGDGARMPGATLHMTHLGSHRTWCVSTDAEGITAELGGELPLGVYALSVTEPSRAAAYEIVLRKL